MQVTDVRVRKIEKEGKMKAIVSITLDNEFVIHDIKVIEGEKNKKSFDSCRWINRICFIDLWFDQFDCFSFLLFR